MAKRKWMQDLKLKKGALHKQLGIPASKKIPVRLLEKIVHANVGDKITYRVGNKTVTKRVTALLKRRANLALVFKRVSK